MNDVLNVKATKDEAPEEASKAGNELTVARLLQDMEQYPKDAPIFACVSGIGMTIPIVGAFKVSTQDNLELVALQIDMPGTIKALEHGQLILQTKNDAGNTQ
jgi:hypothetical protein